MPLQSACSLALNPSDIEIKRELSRSKASTIYEIRLFGEPCVMKLVSSNLCAPKDGADLPVPR